MRDNRRFLQKEKKQSGENDTISVSILNFGPNVKNAKKIFELKKEQPSAFEIGRLDRESLKLKSNRSIPKYDDSRSNETISMKTKANETKKGR